MIQNNGLKVCSRCRYILELTEFYNSKSQPDGLMNYCKKCIKLTHSINPKRKQWMSFISQRSNNRTKQQLLTFLGGECLLCKISDFDVLELDHKFDDGSQDRKRFPHNDHYRYYLKNLKEAKEKLQILCANCNRKKQLYRTEFVRLERYGLVCI